MLKSFIAAIFALFVATFGVHQATVATSLPPAAQSAHTQTAAAAAAATSDTGTSDTTAIYTVLPGDTISGIAEKLGVTQSDILASNNLKNNSLLKVGRKLQIPTTPRFQDLSSSGSSASQATPATPSTPTNSGTAAPQQPSDADLNAKLAALTAVVGNIVSLLPSMDSDQQQQASAYIPLGDGAPNTIAAASNIGQLTNVTVSGISGLTAADIPALAYLPSAGGSVSGLSSFTNASTSVLSVSGPAYFGSTSASSFDRAGALTLASALNIASGGTGWTNINSGSILFGNGASALATSSNLFWDNADGRLGIGTTTPTAILTLDSSSPNGTIMRVSNSSTGGHIYDWLSTGSANTGGAGRLDLFDYTEGAARLSIASNGNVGIASTTPGSIFSVAGVANWTSATSTYYSTGGINLASGCFAISGACIGGGGGGPTYTFSYPLLNTASTISEAWGTTTANSWSQLQKFSGGIQAIASSTIGGGTAATGLTIAGGATTTGTSYFMNGTGANTPGVIDVANDGATKGYTIGNGTWFSTAIPYLRPTDTNGGLAFDLMPNTATTTVWEDICSTDIVIDSNDYECLHLAKQGNNVATIGTTASGGGTARDLELQPVAPTTPASQGTRVIVGVDTSPLGRMEIVQGGAAGEANFGLSILSASNDTALGFGALAGTSGYGYIQSEQRANSYTNRPLAIMPLGGNVGIGTTNPYSRLQITGPDTASTSAFAVVNSASTTVFAVFDSGNSTYSGSIFQSSDERLKTDIVPLDGSSSLAAILSLDPISYTRIDQPGGGENLGFLAQAVQTIFPELVSTTSPTALTPDGTLTLNYSGLIAPIIASIQGIANITDEFETNLIAWLGNANNGIENLFAKNIYATNIHAQEIEAEQLCVGDSANDPDPICLTKSQVAAILAAAGQSDSTASSSEQGSAGGTSGDQATSTPDTPPVIQINGDNPAIAKVGATYNDLGATITGPQADLNLGIDASVDGEATTTPGQIAVDTSQPGTHTILYCATDQSGLGACAIRTVTVVASASNDNNAATSSAAASSSS